MDAVLASLLDRDPTGRLLLLGHKLTGVTDAVQRRMEGEGVGWDDNDSNDSSPSASSSRPTSPQFSLASAMAKGRVCFLPNMPVDLFLSVNMLSDVVLEPFPFGGGVTVGTQA